MFKFLDASGESSVSGTESGVAGMFYILHTDLIVLELTVQVSALHVDLVDLEIVAGCEGESDAD